MRLFDYDMIPERDIQDNIMGNKLFCTFTTGDLLESTLEQIQTDYTILFNKIFVLYAKDQEEYLCTYNIDLNNISKFPKNTILVHRKRESKTLYTINALNILIRSLNGGYLDQRYQLQWQDYQNCVLLTKGPELRKVSTSLHKILEV